eukprot:Rhum_TRINITY_DN9632_c0_g1::Rhum_TRINITY_DN9632_c0_g1_i2::g.34443::m.34443
MSSVRDVASRCCPHAVHKLRRRRRRRNGRPVGGTAAAAAAQQRHIRGLDRRDPQRVREPRHVRRVNRVRHHQPQTRTLRQRRVRQRHPRQHHGRASARHTRREHLAPQGGPLRRLRHLLRRHLVRHVAAARAVVVVVVLLRPLTPLPDQRPPRKQQHRPAPHTPRHLRVPQRPLHHDPVHAPAPRHRRTHHSPHVVRGRRQLRETHRRLRLRSPAKPLQVLTRHHPLQRLCDAAAAARRQHRPRSRCAHLSGRQRRGGGGGGGRRRLGLSRQRRGEACQHVARPPGGAGVDGGRGVPEDGAQQGDPPHAAVAPRLGEGVEEAQGVAGQRVGGTQLPQQRCAVGGEADGARHADGRAQRAVGAQARQHQLLQPGHGRLRLRQRRGGGRRRGGAASPAASVPSLHDSGAGVAAAVAAVAADVAADCYGRHRKSMHAEKGGGGGRGRVQ